MRARLLSFLLVMFALAFPALAQDRRGGSLDRVLPHVRQSVPGTFYDAEGPFFGPDGRPSYRLKWMTPDGRIIWFSVDAQNGRVLGAVPTASPRERNDAGRSGWGSAPRNDWQGGGWGDRDGQGGSGGRSGWGDDRSGQGGWGDRGGQSGRGQGGWGDRSRQDGGGWGDRGSQDGRGRGDHGGQGGRGQGGGRGNSDHGGSSRHRSHGG